MMNRSAFLEKVGELQDEIRQLTGAVDDGQRIRKTAERLLELNYTPPVPLSVDRFLTMRRQDLQEEIAATIKQPDEVIRAMAAEDGGDCLELRLRRIAVLVYYFKQLAQLRLDDPDSWDEVDEMYVHD